jgi:hypothetical protein
LKQRPATLLKDQSGIVILGPLIVFVVIFSTMILIGMIINRADQPPADPPLPREIRYAAAPLEVRFGGRITARREPGEELWVRLDEEGEATVYESEESNVIIGFVPDSLLTMSP